MHILHASDYNAMLFDMDGVITDTAGAHAAAWKKLFDEFLADHSSAAGGVFEPFSIRDDYPRLLDGLPRYEGVRRFLASRGIELPEGSGNDGPGKNTVHGLGNRKDTYFHAWLEENRVERFPGTIELIHKLRDAGLRIGAFSASRNARRVLESADVLELFDTVVDGNDARDCDLPGKPDPAMLLEAARRLGVDPARTVIAEDSLAGVEAGAAGGFALVIGVDRANQADDLAAHGADIVVSDLDEIRVADGGSNSPHADAAVHALDHLEDFAERLDGRDPVVLLDYDGTLTPIVEHHDQAFLAPETRETLARLGRQYPVAIVSGRDLARLTELVSLRDLHYAGSHGFEIRVAQQPDGPAFEQGSEYLPDLDAAEQELHERLAEVDGCAIERKRYSIAVHYRRCRDEDLPRVEQAVEQVANAHDRLQRKAGKKVHELQPAIDWDKGRAVRWLLTQLGLDTADRVPIYIGDDVTDEDAFRELGGSGDGIGIRVSEDPPTETAAEFFLRDPDEVRGFLDWLAGRRPNR